MTCWAKDAQAPPAPRRGSCRPTSSCWPPGTLGSTQILLRSRDLGLPVSDRLGHGFSGNGDVIAFAYDTDAPVRGVGLGGRVPREDTLVGPAITGLIDLRGPGTDKKDALIIEEGSIPGALAAMLPIAMDVASCEALDEKTASVARRLRELAEIPLGSYHGPVDRTLTYLVMSTDDSGGRIVLENDRIHVEWPEVAEQPVFARDNQILAAGTQALHGTEIADPLWTWTSGRSLITVHPLGGCVMADDAANGVVDHRGRVFDPAGGGVHDGLYVCDGSVIPVALDANPLLTISAIAERTAAMMIEERGWGTAQAPVPAAPPPPVEAAPRASLEFTEHLTGFVSMSVHDGYAEGYEDGREDGARVDLQLTIEYDDVQAVLDDPKREARITGTVLAPELSPHPLTVTEGSFTLLDPDPSRVETWRMRYRMRLLSQEGSTVPLRRPQGDPHARGRPRLVRDDDALHDDQRGGGRVAAGHGDLAPEAGRLHQAGPQHQGRRRAAPQAGRVPPGVPGAVRPRDGAHLRRRARRARRLPERAEKGARRCGSPGSRTGSGGATAAGGGTPTTGSATTPSCG